MNDKISKYLSLLKKPKTLIAVGAIGIGLVIFSSWLPSAENEKKSNGSYYEAIDAEEFRLAAEESVKQIVTGISGDNNPTVVITLESGVRYSYVEELQSDSSNSSGRETAQSSESKSQSYITVKNSEGGEEPLIITELMPEIRGVAVICNGGDNSEISEKIENAVTAALSITSKRVYITGGNVYEEG